MYLKTGQTLSDLRAHLINEKIISSALWYDLTVKALRFKKYKPGKYKISDGSSLFQLVRMFRSGVQEPVNLVITKLRTTSDLASRMGRIFEFDSASAAGFLSNHDSLKALGYDSTTIMSIVLPNTYSFYWNSSPGLVMRRLRQESQKIWNEERKKKAEKLSLTPVQVVTLASIIDEESNYAAEKPTIASVYLNRLKINMPLQADPTLKFAMKNFGLKRIYQKHFEVESPYNTYKNSGLPPGPICTPQIATIDAVLNAPETNYLYFVAKSDFSGAHVFTSAYSDHLKYAAEFHKAQNEQEAIRKANKK